MRVFLLRESDDKMPKFIFKQYDRTYNNFDKCMACIGDIVLICKKQENYEIGKRIEKLLNELELIKEQTNEKQKGN